MDEKTLAIFLELPEIKNLAVPISTIDIQRLDVQILDRAESAVAPNIVKVFILDRQGKTLCQVGVRMEYSNTLFGLGSEPTLIKIPGETVGNALMRRMNDEGRNAATFVAVSNDDAGAVTLYRVSNPDMGLVEYLTRDVRASVQEDLRGKKK